MTATVIEEVETAQSSELLTVKQAAVAVGRTKRTIWRWIEKGRLPRIRHGQALIRRDDLLRAEREAQRDDPVARQPRET